MNRLKHRLCELLVQAHLSPSPAECYSKRKELLSFVGLSDACFFFPCLFASSIGDLNLSSFGHDFLIDRSMLPHPSQTRTARPFLTLALLPTRIVEHRPHRSRSGASGNRCWCLLERYLDKLGASCFSARDDSNRNRFLSSRPSMPCAHLSCAMLAVDALFSPLPSLDVNVSFAGFRVSLDVLPSTGQCFDFPIFEIQAC
mmetsp:Transcript_26448/g.103046  ORF Transcript_26448/g.103046 Transcript_26448/m.103046 type:complete len:200 (+) Transcript_26448:1995-2594(+)